MRRANDIPFAWELKSVGEQKTNMVFARMPARSCRVTIEDFDGVSHTVEVTAATLYEAVAQGLAAIRGNEWVAGIAMGLNTVKVSVSDVRVEHEVKLGDFTNGWIDRAALRAREVIDTGFGQF